MVEILAIIGGVAVLSWLCAGGSRESAEKAERLHQAREEYLSAIPPDLRGAAAKRERRCRRAQMLCDIPMTFLAIENRIPDNVLLRLGLRPDLVSHRQAALCIAVWPTLLGLGLVLLDVPGIQAIGIIGAALLGVFISTLILGWLLWRQQVQGDPES